MRLPFPFPLRHSRLGTLGLFAAFLLPALAGCDSGATKKEESNTAAKAPAPRPSEDPASESGEKPTAGADQAAIAQTSGTEEDAASDDSTPLAPPGESGGEADSETAMEPAAQEVAPGVDPLVPQGITRATTEGWWRIVFSFQGQDFSAGFVKIGKSADGKFQVEEVRTNDIVNPAQAVESEATDKTVRIAFAHEDNAFDYVGELADNVIRGNLQFKTSRQERVRLIPVAEADVTDAALDQQQIGETFGGEAINEVIQTTDGAVEELREVATVWGKSPILFDAYDVLFQQARSRGLDRPTVEALATEFESAAGLWGERAKQAAKLNTAFDLMITGYQVDLARQKLEEVRKDAPELTAGWEKLFTMAERVAAVSEAATQVKSGQTAEGLESLRRLHAEKPIDPMAVYHLASAERDHGSKDEALRLFARLAALPQSERELGFVTAEADYEAPRLAAAKLFEEKHGNRDGLESYLDEVYRESVTSFLTDADRSRTATESGRTVLVELFTGAMCPPCVAADVATEAVEKSFPGSDVVVLRYHLHIPGPDPLTNDDSVARADFYGEDVGGTPTIMVDGIPVPYGVGGGYSGSPEIYAQLATTIAEEAQKPQQAEIELTATVEGEVLRIAAKASGIETPSDTLRLRLAVAESHIGFSARNGIREHEMIVREMPGGAAGIAAANGELAFEQEIPLVELRDRLDQYLDRTESELTEQFGQPVTFGVRPLDLRKLTVVAFLQDDATREVLQAVVVPIDQEIELPPLARKPDAGNAAEAGEAADGPSLSPQS